MVTYGDIAREVGSPAAARAVGRVLAAGGADLPWWRVVTATGRLVPGHESEQVRLLEGEGVRVRRGRVLVRGADRPHSPRSAPPSTTQAAPVT